MYSSTFPITSRDTNYYKFKLPWPLQSLAKRHYRTWYVKVNLGSRGLRGRPPWSCCSSRSFAGAVFGVTGSRSRSRPCPRTELVVHRWKSRRLPRRRPSRGGKFRVERKSRRRGRKEDEVGAGKGEEEANRSRRASPGSCPGRRSWPDGSHSRKPRRLRWKSPAQQ